jgi:hypothetical protein
MKITLTVYVKQEPEQTIDDRMKVPMQLAETFAEVIQTKSLDMVQGFDVGIDLQDAHVTKSTGVPSELLRSLADHAKNKE